MMIVIQNVEFRYASVYRNSAESDIWVHKEQGKC